MIRRNCKSNECRPSQLLPANTADTHNNVAAEPASYSTEYQLTAERMMPAIIDKICTMIYAGWSEFRIPHRAASDSDRYALSVGLYSCIHGERTCAPSESEGIGLLMAH